MVHLFELTNPQLEGFSFAACKKQLQNIQAAYDDVKETLLLAGTQLRMPIPGIIDIVEQNSRIRHMGRQMYKAVQNINEISTDIKAPVKETATGIE